MPPAIGDLTPGFPAEKAGLRPGDLVTAVNGKAVSHWLELSALIHKNPGQNLELAVQRGKEVFKLNIVPQAGDQRIGFIGIQPLQNTFLKRYGPIEATRRGLSEVGKLFSLNLSFLGRVFSGQASTKSIGGPIVIAQLAGSAAESGASDLFYFMGFLSLQLGIINLMPIPILDGGLCFFLLLEAIMRRPLSLKKRELAQQIGLALIISLMVFAFYNDIVRILPSIMRLI